ncbi:O-antigen ligase family protein [Dyella sp. KRB-257]|uniref:O-antigen ligase family protein n=1 Tax=Dyella sp. KRB-257 TaxID=3400915 RepID=UPI003C0060EF
MRTKQMPTTSASPAPHARAMALDWLLAVLPLGFAMSSRLKIVPMAVLAVIGAARLLRDPATRRIAWGARWVIAAVSLRLVYDIGNVLAHRLGWAPLDLPSQTLAFIAIAAVFARPVDRRILTAGTGATAVVLGLACLYQRYVMGVDRPYGLNGGEWAAIEFAMYLLVMVLLSLLEMMRPQNTRGARWLHGAAAMLGLYGAILTQSRGPLLAFGPVCFALVLWSGWQSGHWRRAALTLGCVVAGMLVVTLSLQREMVMRLAAVPHEMTTLSSQHTHGAIRERLEMWTVAWRAFETHPLAGIGLDQFGTYVQQQAAQGRASAAIARYVHPHSEYFESIVAGGLPALVVLGLFLGVPLGFFLRRLCDSDPAIRFAAAGGAATVALYGLCAFSDNVFYRAMPHSLYLFIVLGGAMDISRRTAHPTPPDH